MQPERPTLLVLKPSVFSVIVSLLLGTVMLGVANWSYIIDSLPFYDYFFGPEGLVTALQNSEEGSQAVTSTLFSQSLINNILTLLAALGVGLVVFIILEIVRRVRTPDVPISPREAHRKAIVRVTVGILWLIYLQLTIKVLLPFCLLAAQVGIKALWQPKGFLYIVFGLALFCLCLHVHVICARLMLLRLRVFGGTATLLDAERHF
jgi:hypothetical protein